MTEMRRESKGIEEPLGSHIGVQNDVVVKLDTSPGSLRARD